MLSSRVLTGCKSTVFQTQPFYTFTGYNFTLLSKKPAEENLSSMIPSDIYIYRDQDKIFCAMKKWDKDKTPTLIVRGNDVYQLPEKHYDQLNALQFNADTVIPEDCKTALLELLSKFNQTSLMFSIVVNIYTLNKDFDTFAKTFATGHVNGVYFQIIDNNTLALTFSVSRDSFTQADQLVRGAIAKLSNYCFGLNHTETILRKYNAFLTEHNLKSAYNTTSQCHSSFASRPGGGQCH